MANLQQLTAQETVEARAAIELYITVMVDPSGFLKAIASPAPRPGDLND